MGATDRFLKRGRIQDFSRGPIAKMLSELKKFGANGHLYIPGVGAISGITAGNYLDSIGTTNASVDGNVGLVLDGVGSLGAELFPVLNFNSVWTAIGTAAATANNAFSMTGSAGSGFAIQPLTVGKTYRLRVDFTKSVGANLIVSNSNSSAYPIVAADAATTGGVLEGNFKAETAYIYFRLATASGSIVVNSFSVREITGIHASQATTGYQPKLRRGIVNNYTYSHDASNAAYSKTNIAVSAVGGLQKITPNAGTAQHYVSKTYTAVSGNAFTKSVAAKADGFDWVWLYGSNPVAHAYFNVATGQIGNVTGGTATIAQGPDGYYVCALSCTATGAAWAFETHSVGSNGGGSTTTGDGTKGTLLKACAVFDGTLTAQQILDAGGIPLTTTAPVSSAAGAYKWEFDGTDDRSLLGSVPFQLSDDFAIFAAHNCADVSSVSWRSLFGAKGAGTARIQFYSQGGKVFAYLRDDAGVAMNPSSGAGASSGVSGLLKVGGNAYLRSGGAQVSVNSATFGAATLTEAGIGCLGNGSSDFYQGTLGPMAWIKGTLTPAQALIFERGLNAIAQYAAGRF